MEKNKKEWGGGGKGKKRKMFVQIWHRIEMIVLDLYMERRVYARASDIISNLSKANLDLCVHLKRRSKVATLNNVAAYYRDDHSALPISGSMPILSLYGIWKSLRDSRWMSMSITCTYRWLRSATASFTPVQNQLQSTYIYEQGRSIIHIRMPYTDTYTTRLRSTLFVFNETYPKRADFSGVAAVGILFLSLEQNSGE